MRQTGAPWVAPSETAPVSPAKPKTPLSETISTIRGRGRTQGPTLTRCWLPTGSASSSGIHVRCPLALWTT